METLNAFFDFLLRPCVVWIVLSNLIGQFVKTLVFTKDRAMAPGRWRRFWRFMRRTLPLHPAVAGFLLGLLWPGTIEGSYAGGTLPGALYFAVSGAVSVWAFEVGKGLLRKYEGIEISNVFEESSKSTMPPPPRK